MDSDHDYEGQWLTEYEDDQYAAVMDDEDLDYVDPIYPGFTSFAEILEYCIEPTLRDGLLHVGKLVVWCIVFRIATQSTRFPRWLCHMISVATGLICLAHFFYLNVVYLVVLSLLSLASLYLSHAVLGSNRGVSVAVASIALNTACELYFASPVDWHQVRGAQMILSMKAISLGFDMDNAIVVEATPDGDDGPKNRGKKAQQAAASKQPDPDPARAVDLNAMPTALEFLGYAFCPGNSVFGPWIKYEDYMRIFESPKWNSTWLATMVLSLVKGLMFLTISTCWIPLMIPDRGNWKWWIAHRDAMSFRTSHYFVSFVSEVTAAAAGIGFSQDGERIQVTQPHEIELPRSLVEVVKAWNIPMHIWLKTYCFKVTRKYGKVIAILATYFASTMLHGLNFQLAAVLLSLGFYTWTEHKLRQRLADIFDASITASRPTDPNAYQNREATLLVMIANFGFGLLAYFNLAYLGVMFNQDQSMAEGYSWRHTLSKWQELDFLSTWAMAFLFILSCLI